MLELNFAKIDISNKPCQFRGTNYWVVGTLGGWYPRSLIVHQQRYTHSESNKNVDIQIMAHDASLG